MNRTTVLPTAALTLALTLTACADDGEDTASPTSAPAPASPSPSSTASRGATSAAPTSPAPAEGRTIDVTYASGEVTGDTGRVPVPVGETVTIVVASDVADEVHVHGYDVSAPVTPGTPTTLTLDATIPGVFQVELEQTGKALFSLQVA